MVDSTPGLSVTPRFMNGSVDGAWTATRAPVASE